MAPSKSNKLKFSIYRYQIHPVTTAVQQTLFDLSLITYDELIDKKNLYFRDIVSNPKTRYRGHGYNVISKVEFAESNDILLRFGVQKSKEIHKEDFRKDAVKDYPNIFVFINIKEQLIYIQKNLDAFTDTDTVKNFMLSSLGRKLSSYNLDLYIEQTYNKTAFWETIMKYEGRVTYLKFEFIKENLADIGKRAVEEIKALKNNLNGHKVGLDFKAPKNGVLENLNESNNDVSSLLSYQIEGGGPPPYIRAKGIKGLIKTADSERIIEIEDYEGDPNELQKIIKELKK